MDEQLKKIRDQSRAEKESSRLLPETYIDKGLSRAEAMAYIESLKTQDLLSERMSSKNQTEHGRQL